MVVDKIKNELANVPESEGPRDVERRLCALAEREYGDIFDGVRVRVDNSERSKP